MKPFLEISICRDIAAFQMLNNIFVEAFSTSEDPPVVEELLQQLLGDPRFVPIVCEIEGKVVGGATLYILPSYLAREPVVYLYDLAITPVCQGRGIGRRLLEFVKKNAERSAHRKYLFNRNKTNESLISIVRLTQMKKSMSKCSCIS